VLVVLRDECKGKKEDVEFGLRSNKNVVTFCVINYVMFAFHIELFYAESSSGMTLLVTTFYAYLCNIA